MSVAPLNRTLEQELFALLRGASLECLVCGEFVMHRRGEITCPECGMTLRRDERWRPRAIAAGGLAGCALLAFSLPLPSVLAGGGLLAIGAAVYAIRRSFGPRKRTAGPIR